MATLVKDNLHAAKCAALEKARSAPRIYWTPTEETELMANVADLLLAMGIGHVPPPTDKVGSQLLVNSLWQAQENVLLPNRRKGNRRAGRAIFARRNFFERLEVILQAKAKELTGRNGAPAPVPPPVEAPPDPVPPPEPPKLALADASLPDLLAVLFGRFFELLERKAPPAEIARLDKAQTESADMQRLILDRIAELEKQVDTMTPRLMPEKPADPPAPIIEIESENGTEPRRPRVAIVGCRRDQFEHLFAKAKEHALAVELRYYDATTRPVNIRADYALAMRFLEHAWADKAKAAVPAKNFVFLRGSVSQMLEQLLVWFPTGSRAPISAMMG